MGMLILVAIIAVVIYIYSFNNRDKNLDYKLTPEYQKSGYDDKLRTDIIKGLEITIKKEIIGNYSNKDFRRKAIENFIETRESYFYLNIESLSQQHKISHNATFDAIFDACNYIRVQFDIPAQSVSKTSPREEIIGNETQSSSYNAYQLKEMMKKSIIEGIRTSEVIKRHKGTELEIPMTLNFIASYCEHAVKKFVDDNLAKGLTKQEAIYVVKTATNEVIDMYIPDAKQYHIM